jgi:hypothetical protein
MNPTSQLHREKSGKPIMNELITVFVRGKRKVYFNREHLFTLPDGWVFKGSFDFPRIDRHICSQRGRRRVGSFPPAPISL